MVKQPKVVDTSPRGSQSFWARHPGYLPVGAQASNETGTAQQASNAGRGASAGVIVGLRSASI